MKISALSMAGFLAIFILLLQLHPTQAEPVSPSLAADITVNTLEDELNTDGDCSLREAVTAANMNSARDACPAGTMWNEDRISFASGGVISLTTPITVTFGGPLIINGDGMITLDGRGMVRGLFVEGGGDLSLQGLTITNGNGGDFMGGGILNSGNLSIRQCTISNNHVELGGAGGGISNSGTLRITDSLVSGNVSAGIGAGLFQFSGSTEITATVFLSNTTLQYWGGGAYIWDGNMRVTQSTFQGNQARNGGGIYNLGAITITESIFAGNQVIEDGLGGGIFNGNNATAVVTDTTFMDNYAYNGAGIYNDMSGTLEVVGSTFTIGYGLFGGSITNGGIATVTNSTFSGNVAAILGGGFFSINQSAQATISNSTFYGNSSQSNTGAGVAQSAGTVTLHNTIVAGTMGTNCNGIIVDGGYNLDSANDCGFDSAIGSLINTDPLLEALANNHGPTLTHMPQVGSPVIDAGDPVNCPPVDQRGNQRAVDGNGDGISVCDMGSVEIYPFRVWLPVVIKD